MMDNKGDGKGILTIIQAMCVCVCGGGGGGGGGGVPQQCQHNVACEGPVEVSSMP